MPPRCPACGTVVFSLFGQSEQLDSYLLEPGGPPRGTAGTWHTRCLATSSCGAAWAAARMKHMVEVRGYVVIDRLDAWRVLEDPRDGERMGLSDQGALLVLPAATRVERRPWGRAYRERKGEYNLDLPMPALIQAMQAALQRDGVCAMAMMFDATEVWPYLQHPVSLADARFVYDDDLREAWGAEWLSAKAEYDVLVPPAMLAYCR